MRVRSLLALGCVTVAIALTGAQPSASGELPSTTHTLKLFAPTFMMKTATYSQADAVTIARNYDLVAAKKTQFVGQVDAMHAANPNVRVLVYLNGHQLSRLGPSRRERVRRPHRQDRLRRLLRRHARRHPPDR
jgi:hypothetical protein